MSLSTFLFRYCQELIVLGRYKPSKGDCNGIVLALTELPERMNRKGAFN